MGKKVRQTKEVAFEWLDGSPVSAVFRLRGKKLWMRLTGERGWMDAFIRSLGYPEDGGLSLILSRDRKNVGVTRDVGDYCGVEGCGGSRVWVDWDEGGATVICSKAMGPAPGFPSFVWQPL